MATTIEAFKITEVEAVVGDSSKVNLVSNKQNGQEWVVSKAWLEPLVGSSVVEDAVDGFYTRNMNTSAESWITQSVLENEYESMSFVSPYVFKLIEV